MSGKIRPDGLGFWGYAFQSALCILFLCALYVGITVAWALIRLGWLDPADLFGEPTNETYDLSEK